MESTRRSGRTLASFERIGFGTLCDEGQESSLGDEATPAEADDGQLAAGDELVGEGAGDPEQLPCFGDRIDETISRGFDGLVSGGHRRHIAPWTSTKVSTETSTTGKSMVFLPGCDVQGGQGTAEPRRRYVSTCLRRFGAVKDGAKLTTYRRRPLTARNPPEDTMEVAGPSGPAWMRFVSLCRRARLHRTQPEGSTGWPRTASASACVSLTAPIREPESVLVTAISEFDFVLTPLDAHIGGPLIS
jgi:hypothetical protein